MTTDDGLKGWREHVQTAYLELRAKNHTIPSEVLEEMRDILLSYRANVHDSGDVSYEVWQEGMCVAGASGDGALDEAHHYAMMYGQDGPVTVYRVTTTRAILAEKGEV